MSEPRTFVIRVGVRRSYGAHEIYYEISEQIEVESGEERRSAFLNLQAQLDDQVKVYEEISLPHVKLPAGTKGSGAASVSLETFPLELIKVEFQDGSKRIKACGGKYMKWGVPVYKECFTELPIETLAYGPHDYRDLKLTCTADVEGGKPVRVRAIK